MLPHWLFLPVFVSSNLQYNEAENVDVPIPIFYAQAPFQANNFVKKKSNQEKNFPGAGRHRPSVFLLPARA